jgi:sulfur-carrier protein
MAIRIQLFAAFAEFAGTRESELPFTPGLRCTDIWSQMSNRYPRLKAMRPLFARNDEYVHPETELQDRDVLMIFPPVSGG